MMQDVANIKLSPEGEKYLAVLSSKKAEWLTLDEEYQMPMLVAMRIWEVIGSEMFTLIMCRYEDPVDAAEKMFMQMVLMMQEGYVVKTQEPTGYTDKDILQLNEADGPEILRARDQMDDVRRWLFRRKFDNLQD